MGLFGKLFGDNKEEAGNNSQISWNALHAVSDLDGIVEKSENKTQLIFKHSRTCGISRMVLNMFERETDISPEQVDFYFLDIHQHRDISNAIESKFNVIHESPQLLLLKNGVVSYHTSHGGISDTDVKKLI